MVIAKSITKIIIQKQSYNFPSSFQFCVKMLISDFVVDETLLRAELKSVSTASGAQFAMTGGMMQMLQLSVPSLAFLQKVS